MTASVRLKPSEPLSAPTETSTDEQLVDALRRGDAAAGDVLVKRYHDVLYRYLYRNVRSAYQAEELLQLTWLSVLEHLDQYRRSEESGFGFKAWLFRIATNKATDFWRSRARQRTAYEGLALVRDEEAPDAGHGMDAQEQSDRLRAAVAELPEPQRQVVTMRYYGHMKFQEIALTLGCPLSTALGRMHKAIKRLRRVLG